MAFQRSTDNIDVPNRRQANWADSPNGYDAQALNQSYLAGATVNAYRIVKFSAANTVIQGAAAADTIIGINQSPQAALVGDQTMICFLGVGQVECGGVVAAGDLLTTDTVGRAVVSLAAPTDRVIGVALAAGTLGVVIPCVISPSKNGGVT